MKVKELRHIINEANKDYEKAMVEVLRTRTTMERELESVKEKYAPTIKTLEDNLSDKWDNFRKMARIYYNYGKYSRDKAGNISNILCNLLTYVEGEKFIPYINEYNIPEGSIIIRESALESYDKDDWHNIDKLCDKGDLIVVDDGRSNDIEFYDCSAKPKFKFGEFTYLTQFVEDLVQYRMDNKKYKSTLDYEELSLCMNKFLSVHPELTLKNKDKREKMMTEECEKVLKI